MSKTAERKVVMRDTLLWEINDCKHGFFYVKFIKRSDGTIREMICQRGVTAHLKGGEKAYNAAEKGLITVYSTRDKGYRSIPIEGIISAKINGVRYVARGKEKLDEDSQHVEVEEVVEDDIFETFSVTV